MGDSTDLSASDEKVSCPGPGWKRNTGERPRGSRDKRVRVILAHGKEGKHSGVSTAPPGWAANTCNWSIVGWDFDIVWYLVL